MEDLTVSKNSSWHATIKKQVPDSNKELNPYSKLMALSQITSLLHSSIKQLSLSSSEASLWEEESENPRKPWGLGKSIPKEKQATRT